MKSFRVVQTDAQADSFLPYIEEAEKECDGNGRYGAVFCQVKRDWRANPVYIVGNFIPEPYAERIGEIIEEWRSKLHNPAISPDQDTAASCSGKVRGG